MIIFKEIENKQKKKLKRIHSSYINTIWQMCTLQLIV